MNRARASAIGVLILVSLGLTGCASYSQPRYAGDGVYYEHPRHYQPSSRVYVHSVNPLIYPYWSLDYFYFSRYYHPYSVLVHRYDPWFYPYPGWYYGYRPGPRTRLSFSFGYYYPWYSYGSHYHYYRPWQTTAHFSYWHYRSAPRHQHPSHDRVRVVDERLRQMERRQAAAARADRRHRGPMPGVSPHGPVTTRMHASGAHERTATRQQQPARLPSRTERQTDQSGASHRDVDTLRHRLQTEPQRPAPRPRTGNRSDRDTSPPAPQLRIQQPRSETAPPETRSAPERSRSESPPPRARSTPRRDRSSSSSSRPSRSSSSPPPRSRSAPQRSTRGSSTRQRDRDR